MAPKRGFEQVNPAMALNLYSGIENYFGIKGLNSPQVGIDFEPVINKTFAIVDLLQSTGVVEANYPFSLGTLLHLTQNEGGLFLKNGFDGDSEDQIFNLNKASEFVLSSAMHLLSDTIQDFPDDQAAINYRVELLRQTLYAIGIEDSAERIDNQVGQLMLESAANLLFAHDYCIQNETRVKTQTVQMAGRNVTYKIDPLNNIQDEEVKALAFNLRDLEDRVIEVSNTYGGDSDVLRSNLVNLMQGFEFPENATAEDISSIMHYRMPAVDYVTMIKIIHENDLEGLAINTAQYIVELQDAPFNADSWRKAQTILSFYAPLLELVGLDALAKEAYSSAYVFLYSGENQSDKQIVQQAITIYENANRVLKTSNLDSKLTDSLLKAKLGISPDRITTRVKSLGSIMDKLERDRAKGRDTQIVSDAIGTRIIIPNPPRNGDPVKHTRRYISAVLQSLVDSGCEIEDPRGGPAIEWRLESNNNKTNKIRIDNQEYEMKLSELSKTGYGAVHIIAQKDGVAYEVQIQTEHEAEINETIASHAFYKIKGSFSRLGALMKIRDGESNPEIRKLETKRINSIIYGILSLALEQNGRFEKLKTGEMYYLNPTTRETMFNVLAEYNTKYQTGFDDLDIRDITDPLVLYGDWKYLELSQKWWENIIYNSQ